MTQVADDLFDNISIDMPVEVESPPIKVIPIRKTAIVKEKGPEPAYSILKRNALTESEYTIYTTAMAGIEEIATKHGTESELVEDCSKIKMNLLNILAQKFGYRDAAQARENNLSFKLKQNFEIELLKKRNAS